jgi:hypothetical protein
MYTEVPLQWVAIALGAFVIFTRAPGLIWTGAFRRFWLALPRSKAAGYLLMGIAMAWCATAIYLTGFMDAHEWENSRGLGVLVYKLLLLLRAGQFSVWVFFAAIYALIVWWLNEFLAVRGMALIALLVARVILDAAFDVETEARLVMTATAYVMVVAGMWLTISPWRLRDVLEYTLANDQRCRAFCGAGVAFGVVLVALGIWVY